MSSAKSPAGRGAAGRTRSQAQPPQAQPPLAPQQQQPPEIAQLQAQVQQLLTQVQNQSNTIANLKQQQAAAAAAPAPARFAVTPAAHTTGFLAFDKKGDTILFQGSHQVLALHSGFMAQDVTILGIQGRPALLELLMHPAEESSPLPEILGCQT